MEETSIRFFDGMSGWQCDEVETCKQVFSEWASIVPCPRARVNWCLPNRKSGSLRQQGPCSTRPSSEDIYSVDVSLPFATRNDPKGQKLEFGEIRQRRGGRAAKRCSLWGSCSPNAAPSLLLYVPPYCPAAQVSLDQSRFLTRTHHEAPRDGKWGAHEIRYFFSLWESLRLTDGYIPRLITSASSKLMSTSKLARTWSGIRCCLNAGSIYIKRWISIWERLGSGGNGPFSG